MAPSTWKTFQAQSWNSGHVSALSVHDGLLYRTLSRAKLLNHRRTSQYSIQELRKCVSKLCSPRTRDKESVSTHGFSEGEIIRHEIWRKRRLIKAMLSQLSLWVTGTESPGEATYSQCEHVPQRCPTYREAVVSTHL